MNVKKTRSIQQYLVLLILGSLFLLALTGCSQRLTATPQAEVVPIIATNTVVSEGHLEPVNFSWLSFQVSGRVEEVLVKEGDQVKKDQPLIRLEGSERAGVELKAAQSAFFLAQQTLEDAINSGAFKAASELRLAEAQRVFNTAQGNYSERNTAQGNAEEIALYNAKVTVMQDQVDKLQDRLDGMAEYSNDDPSKAKAQADLNQAKLDLDKLQKQRDYFADLPDTLDVQTLTAKLNVAKAALEDATRDFERWKDGPSKEALAGLQAQADAARASADQAQWAYDQLVLKAPYVGVFVQCDLTQGTFVPAGQKAALMADFSQWKVETTDLDEIGMAQIDTSKPVAITADALPGQQFSGEVDHVLQSYIDKNGDILYTAKIILNGNDEKLRWGMTMQLEFQKIP